jgi:hypothetical protein
MAGKCISLVKGRRIRLTKVNDCGIPVYGDGNQVTSKGFISVAFTANSTESDEISVQNAAGEVCVFEPSESSFTGYGVEITFCEVDVELFSLATGQQVYLDGNGNAIGFTVNTKIEREGGFALELWAGSPNADVCVDPNAQGSYGYLLFPFIKGGIVGDFTIENGAATFTVSGSTTRDGNGWGTGPYEVLLEGSVPSVLPTPLDSADHGGSPGGGLRLSSAARPVPAGAHRDHGHADRSRRRLRRHAAGHWLGLVRVRRRRVGLRRGPGHCVAQLRDGRHLHGEGLAERRVGRDHGHRHRSLRH